MQPQSPSADIPSSQQRVLEQELFDRAKRVTPQEAEKTVFELPQKIATVVDSVNQKTPGIKRLLENVQFLYKMLRDPSFTISWSAKAILVAGLAYFISPVDFIPDFIPLLGYVDDAFVISAALNAITGEIERYRAFKRGDKLML